MVNTSSRTKEGTPLVALDFIIDNMILPFLESKKEKKNEKAKAKIYTPNLENR